MRNLLIDFSETTSLTSAGLRTLLWLYRLLDGASADAGGTRQKSSHLKLVNLSPNLQRVLQISGFASFIDIYDDLPTAIASFETQD